MDSSGAIIRKTDAKGRITLGEEFASRTVLIEQRQGGLLLRLARMIPEREAWLYGNERALSAVRAGLAEARAANLLETGPDLEAARKLVDRISDPREAE